jgi:Spy/CpxP family protein refolding chaperone
MKVIIAVLTVVVVFAPSQESETPDPGEIIETIRIYRLTNELDLTTEQAVEFFPKLNELQKIENEFHQRRQEILHNLREQLASGAPDKEIRESLDAFEKTIRERVDRKIEKMREIRTLLTPRQQAKYLIFEDEFERDIREMIKEVKKSRPR